MGKPRDGSRLVHELVIPLLVLLLSRALGPVMAGLTDGRIVLPRSLSLGVSAAALVWAGIVTVDGIAARRRRSTRGPGIHVVPGPFTQIHRVMELDYAGARWYVEDWRGATEWAPQSARDLKLHVCTPPRCPSCLTELEKRPHYWGSWTWSCPACSYEVRAERDFEAEASRVLKVARRKIEEGLGEGGGDSR